MLGEVGGGRGLLHFRFLRTNGSGGVESRRPLMDLAGLFGIATKLSRHGGRGLFWV